MKKIIAIIKESIPVVIMVLLIPCIANDYLLTFVYLGIIAVLFFLKREKNDVLVFVVGLIAMTLFESLFISTGVETFIRNSLFSVMPLWLPFLWAYGFVVMKRSIIIIDSK